MAVAVTEDSARASVAAYPLDPRPSRQPLYRLAADTPCVRFANPGCASGSLRVTPP